jgi:hypothetical protein
MLSFIFTPTSIFSPDYPHPEGFKDVWQIALQRANIKSPVDFAAAVATVYTGVLVSAMTGGAISLAPGAGGGIMLVFNCMNPVGLAVAGVAVVAIGGLTLFERRQNRLGPIERHRKRKD